MCCVENLYEIVKRVDRSDEKKSKVAYILPAFQYTLKKREECKDADCFKRMRLAAPSTKNGMKMCVEKKQCQIMNAHLKTYVDLL